MLRLAVDIGGTFTDFVLYDGHGLHPYKTLTTPADPAEGVLDGTSDLLVMHGKRAEEIEVILHATTLATNAVIERKGAKTGLITTAGFEDLLDIRKGFRYDQYDLNIKMPPHVVPRRLRRGVSERITADGQIYTKLNERDVRNFARELVELGVESLAICFLNSYSNPIHEVRAKEVILNDFPDLPVSISSEVAPRIREYERMSTTAINAYIKPIVARYLERMRRGLTHIGFRGMLYLMTSGGGMIIPQLAIDLPILLLESGPAAGALMASLIAQIRSISRCVSFDMGGTTAKGCLIQNGEIGRSYEFEVARYHRFKRGSGLPVLTPSLKLIEIGSGGGSLAYIDELGLLRVGPISAGANPGPACYGLGGKMPTVTDANLILGYLNPSYFCGGAMKLFPDRAAQAIMSHVAKKGGMDVVEAAWWIHEKVNEDIATALRLHAAESGQDLSTFSIIAFGGAAGAHACRIAKKLNINSVILPLGAGVFSAAGLLHTPLAVDLAQSCNLELDGAGFDTYMQLFKVLIKRGKRLAHFETGDEIKIRRWVDMRYKGQGYEVEVPLPTSHPDIHEFSSLKEIFEREYERLYSVRDVIRNVELVGVKVSLIKQEKLDVAWTAVKDETHQALKGMRRAYFPELGGMIECKVYNRYGLSVGEVLEGPLIVEERESTAIIPPGFTASIDDVENIIVEVR
ncbi:MAG: hydantoinase/oxoprolinase family protein [Nitrososphaerota archaeon]